MPVALFSVFNKTGLVEFARSLHGLGWRFLASGGTARTLREAGLAVTEIADYTGSPEILGGRVKTLHPAIHGGILARDSAEDSADLQRIHAQSIDMVVVNLYPFEETIRRPGATLADAIENIDIGGVALIRAAAKNYARVTVVTSPAQYPALLAELHEHGAVQPATRLRLATQAFAHTAAYDRAVAAYFSTPEKQETPQPPDWLAQFPVEELRYGENPHQTARLYHLLPQGGPLGGKVLQGKTLSFNNLLDLDAAWRAAVAFPKPTAAIVKHLSPCGIGCGETIAQAFQRALDSDPVSAFGGVIAANRPFDAAAAAALGSLFVECIIAPGFHAEALEHLAKRKNCRLVSMPDSTLAPPYELRSVNQGLLWQARDTGDPAGTPDWQVVSQRAPTEAEWAALRFAWRACMHVKSNAIVLAQGEATVGIGGGQPNRVDCVKIAIQRASDRARGSVMASDAFFPFPDSIELAAQAGVSAVVHPGGSVRDSESIAAADRYGMALVTTGVRHFRH